MKKWKKWKSGKVSKEYNELFRATMREAPVRVARRRWFRASSDHFLLDVMEKQAGDRVPIAGLGMTV